MHNTRRNTFARLSLEAIFFSLLSLPLIGSLPAAENAPILSFQSTYNVIQSSSFDLQAAEASHESTYGNVTQARALPNPNLIVGLTTIGREVDGDENQLTIAISQLIEMGGKRSARIAKAMAEECAAAWKIEKQRIDLKASLLNTFINIAAQQELLAATEVLFDIANKTIIATQEKEAAGKQSSLDTKKADIVSKTAKIELIRKQIEFKKSKKELTALWKASPDFQGVDFNLLNVAPLPSFSELELLLNNNPDLMYGQAQLLIAWQNIAVEKAEQTPDLALQVGVTAERFVQEPTLNVGISVPLQIFNNNRGNVAKAINQYSEASILQEKQQHTLETNLKLYYEQWSAAYEEVIAVKEMILPQAQEAFEMALEAYKEGKFNYLELLEAQNTLFSVKQQLIEAAKGYHQKKTDVLQLIGFTLPEDDK